MALVLSNFTLLICNEYRGNTPEGHIRKEVSLLCLMSLQVVSMFTNGAVSKDDKQ
jgi:hypothetical protein